MADDLELLLLDNDVFMVDSLLALIRTRFAEGIEVVKMTSAAAAKHWLVDNSPDLVLTDLEMSGMSGFEIVRFSRHRNPQCQVIIYSTLFSDDMLSLGLKLGACDYVTKTADPRDLLDALQHACNRISRWRLQFQNRAQLGRIASTAGG